MYIGINQQTSVYEGDTFLQFSVKLVGNAASLYRRYKRTDLVRLVRNDLAANNLYTKTVA